MTQFPIQNGVAIIPQGTTIINDRAFFGCQDLTTVVIPEGVTTIGGSAFRECSQLSHVVFPSTILVISLSLRLHGTIIFPIRNSILAALCIRLLMTFVLPK